MLRRVCVSGNSETPLGASALLLSKDFKHYFTSKMNMDAMRSRHTLARFHSILQRSLLLASAHRITDHVGACLLGTPRPPRPHSCTLQLRSQWVEMCDDAWSKDRPGCATQTFPWHFLAPGPQRPIFLAFLPSTAFKRERAGLPVKRGDTDGPGERDSA